MRFPIAFHCRDCNTGPKLLVRLENPICKISSVRANLRSDYADQNSQAMQTKGKKLAKTSTFWTSHRQFRGRCFPLQGEIVYNDVFYALFSAADIVVRFVNSHRMWRAANEINVPRTSGMGLSISLWQSRVHFVRWALEQSAPPHTRLQRNEIDVTSRRKMIWLPANAIVASARKIFETFLQLQYKQCVFEWVALTAWAIWLRMRTK